MSDKYALIAAEQAMSGPAPSVSAMCAGLEVSRSGFYDWQRAVPSPRQLRRAKLTRHVHAAFEAGRGEYGEVPRYAVGHSFGGVLTGLMLASQPGSREEVVKAIAPQAYLNQPEELLTQIMTGKFSDGLGNTRNVDEDMVDAQETRRILDRLYGYELSPVLWRKVGPGLSAGRVQSVATRLIVERERERMAFVRASYWDVTAVLGATDAEGEPASFESRMVSLGGKRLAGSKDFSDDGKLTPSGFADNVCQLDEAHANALAKLLADATFTVAGIARVGNDLALAMAARTGLLHREEALLHAHLACAVAGSAGFHIIRVLRAFAVAGIAWRRRGKGDGFFHAFNRFFQRQLHHIAQV